MKSIFLLLLTVVSQIVIAQNTSLVFKSEKDNFILYLNDVQQIKTPTSYLRVNNYNQKIVEVKISLMNNSNTNFSKKIEFDTGGEIQYVIKRIDDEYDLVKEKKLDINAKLPIEISQSEVNYIDKEGREHMPSGKKEKYTGKKGCDRPISTGEAIGLYKSMLKLHYPDEKYKLISKSLKGRCIRVEHVLKLLSGLKNEFYEEKFAIFIHDFIYDLDNFIHVIEVLSHKGQENTKIKLGL